VNAFVILFLKNPLIKMSGKKRKTATHTMMIAPKDPIALTATFRSGIFFHLFSLLCIITRGTQEPCLNSLLPKGRLDSQK
jgi:hypothetical protein